MPANWGRETDWAHGEFSGQSPVNDDDLSLLLANWTGPGGLDHVTIPEPLTFGVLAFGTASLLQYRRGP